MRNTIFFYLTALALLLICFLFFDSAQRKLAHYADRLNVDNTVHSSFQNLSREINNAAVSHYDLVKSGNTSKFARMFAVDSVAIIQRIAFLRATALDSADIPSLDKLHSLIRSELSWIVTSNVPDSIIYSKSMPHLVSFAQIDSLITLGIQRSELMHEVHKREINEGTKAVRLWMIIFIVISSILIIYTVLKYFGQRSKRKIKENELDALINATDDMMWSVDKDLKLIACNEAFINSLKAALGVTVKPGDDVMMADVTSPDRVKLWKGIYDRALHGEVFKQEIYSKPVNNIPEQWREVSVNPIYNNGVVTAFACNARNITESKKAQEAVLKAYEEKNTVLESIDDGFFATDTNSVVTYWNTRAEILLNAKKEDMLGKNLHEMFAENSTQIFYDSYKKATEEKSTITFEGFSNRANKWFTVSAFGSKNGLSVYFKDTTEKKQYELNLTKAIIKTQEDERYEIGGELHENVCQILVGSMLSLGMLKDSLPPSKIELFDKCREYISLSLAEIRNLSHRLAPAFFNEETLGEAFERLVEMCHIEQKIKVSLHVDAGVNTGLVSREIQLNLYRILQEQLKNILKYANATLIEINVTMESNSIKMRVSDDGVGFDVESSKNGIGFANMKRRAELFSGKFDIHSSLGKGCVIQIDIPLRLL